MRGCAARWSARSKRLGAIRGGILSTKSSVGSALKVRFTAAALADLQIIHDWIAHDNPRTASNVVARILQSAATLELFPMAGRAGRVKGTREWPVPRLPWFFVYEMTESDLIDIIAIIHSSRLWPPDEPDDGNA